MITEVLEIILRCVSRDEAALLWHKKFASPFTEGLVLCNLISWLSVLLLLVFCSLFCFTNQLFFLVIIVNSVLAGSLTCWISTFNCLCKRLFYVIYVVYWSSLSLRHYMLSCKVLITRWDMKNWAEWLIMCLKLWNLTWRFMCFCMVLFQC